MEQTTCCISPRLRMILGTVFVLVSVIATLVGLTLGLRDQPPLYGGGPAPENPPEKRLLRAERSVENLPFLGDALPLEINQDVRDFVNDLPAVGGGLPADIDVNDLYAARKTSKDLPADWSIKGPKAFIYEDLIANVRDGDRETKAPFISEYRQYASATVTTETHNCSAVGTDIIRGETGSVVDAAIATWLCVCIVNSHSCGLGGSHFATIYERPVGQTEKVVMALVSRSRAPAASYQDMFVNNTAASSTGGLAVAVPGDIKGFYEAWKVFGRLPWSDLFQTAINLCENGFIVERDLSNAIRQYQTVMRTDPNFSEIFLNDDGSLVQEGDLLINKKLGATLRAIAADPFTFYNGSLAADIVADLDEYGAIITLEDMNRFQSMLKEPLNVTLDNGKITVFNPPPPSSGAVLDFIVNILDGYNFNPSSIADSPSKILTYHRIIESFKFAYAKRSELGDEDFVDVADLVYNLTSDAYADSIRLQIDDTTTHDIGYYGPTFDVEPDSGTAHINIYAPDGAAVAMTGTINLFFGAKVRGRRTGIIFNDDMDDFSTPGTRNAFGVPSSPSNYIVPGKSMMSSMSPSLFLDESRTVLFMSGGAGGTRITTQVAFMGIKSLWFDEDLSNATDTARLHHQLVPNEIVYENWLELDVLNGLRAKNHSTVSSTGIAVVGSVRNRCPSVNHHKRQKKQVQLETCLEAASDARKGGEPDGFNEYISLHPYIK